MALDASLETPTAADTTPAETGAPQTGTAPQPQPSAPPQTYTRKDVDAAYAEARRWKAERETQLRREIEAEIRQQIARGNQPDEQQDPRWQQLGDYVGRIVDQRTASIRQQQTEVALDRAIGDLGRVNPEFADQGKLREILQIVVDNGLDKVTSLSIPQVLELAHGYWLRSQPRPDLEAIRKAAKDEALKEYTGKKITTASKTPRTEGTGAAAPVTGRTKLTKKGEFESALGAALDRMDL